MKNSYFSLKESSLAIFLFVAFVQIAILAFSKEVIWSESVHYEYFRGPDFNSYMEGVRNSNFISYLLSPVFLILRSLAIVILFKLGVLAFLDREKSMSFNKIFQICMLSSLAFSCSRLIQSLYFLFIPNRSRDEINSFPEFALGDLISTDVGFFQTSLGFININLILFIIALLYLSTSRLHIDDHNARRIVLGVIFPGFITLIAVYGFLGVSL
ncbi:MAG: hypothetical protein COW03_00125 [Cytophagales bacterium CG12_big_fil_rev_8_21_14_0_65_40_12]|nr:MAG: hypothetical protein COW03_00125 [Cytophagales bacterium CG12_big_fil_rev_8_21_14_0_65_40_12]PIW04453.1 MAG: hypothetical protein COW40_09685 [Cytophagales bacterium CG17_big_fil_post_rev_8_21_14_2_50_40_13]